MISKHKLCGEFIDIYFELQAYTNYMHICKKDQHSFLCLNFITKT